MVSQTSEFKKPQSTQEEAVLVESTVYSKTENGPALLTRHTLLPQDRLNQDHKTHGLVCWNCENYLSSYLDLASTRFDPDTPSGVYFNMIINSTDEESGNVPRSSILKMHINCANGQGTLLTNTLYSRFFGRGQALTREIPRNESFVLDPHTVTPPSPRRRRSLPHTGTPAMEQPHGRGKTRSRHHQQKPATPAGTRARQPIGYLKTGLMP